MKNQLAGLKLFHAYRRWTAQFQKVLECEVTACKNIKRCQVLTTQLIVTDIRHTTCICFAADGLFNNAEIGVMCFTVLQEEAIPTERQSFSSPMQGQQRYRQCSSTISRPSSGTIRVHSPVNTSPTPCHLNNTLYLTFIGPCIANIFTECNQ